VTFGAVLTQKFKQTKYIDMRPGTVVEDEVPQVKTCDRISCLLSRSSVAWTSGDYLPGIEDSLIWYCIYTGDTSGREGDGRREIRWTWDAKDFIADFDPDARRQQSIPGAVQNSPSMADRVSARQALLNAFFLTVNTALPTFVPAVAAPAMAGSRALLQEERWALIQRLRGSRRLNLMS